MWRTPVRKMTSLADFGKEHIFKGVGRSTSLVLERGEGSYVYTPPADAGFDGPEASSSHGKKYLDFTAGIGVTNLGHCHPKVTKAAQEQVGKMVHAQVNIGFNKPQLELMRALKPLLPHPSLNSFFFWNSGAEAVEASIKLARHATKRQNVIVMQGSYHGRTMATFSMTKSKTVYSQGFHPGVPGIYTIPFPYWHQLGYSSPQAAEHADIDMTEFCLHQLELLLVQQTAPQDTAAIIIETVIGEGGYVPAPREFLEGVRKICDREGILYIADEVQCGFMRTGTMFAIQGIAPNVRPDIVVMAKGLGNGFPISAIAASKELSDTQPPGSMGGTYAGNAVACAAAKAVCEVMQNDGIKENVAARSKQMFAALHELQQDSKTKHLIADVRGRGLMIAVEFQSTPHIGGLPPKARESDNSLSHAKLSEKLASRVSAKCLEKGMLTLTTSVYETIRFIPPLTVSEKEMAEGLQIFKEAVQEVAAEI